MTVRWKHKKPMLYTTRTIEWKFKDTGIPTQYDKAVINTPQDVWDIFYRYYKQQTVEKFLCIWLSTKHGIIGYEEVSAGTLNASLVHPREVFRSAIVAGAASIIVMHNHPSGVMEPSKDDIDITRQLVAAGKTIGISLQDHIIFGDNYYSLAEHDQL
jgi:DNA repair protein RadC